MDICTRSSSQWRFSPTRLALNAAHKPLPVGIAVCYKVVDFALGETATSRTTAGVAVDVIQIMAGLVGSVEVVAVALPCGNSAEEGHGGGRYGEDNLHNG